MAENSAAGTAVGAPVAATDADNDTLAYSMTGTDAALFSIDTATGQLSVAQGAALDYETTTSYTVTVSVTDGSVSFAPGDRFKVINYATVDDSVDEPDGSVAVAIAPGTGYSVGQNSSDTIAITYNDEAAPPQAAAQTIDPQLVFVTHVSDPALVPEPWTPVYTVTRDWEMALSHKPSSNVVVSVTSSDPEHVVVDADDNITFAATEFITFTPDNWDCVQRSSMGTCFGHFVALEALPDADGDEETLTVTIAVVTDRSDDAFDRMNPITINVKKWDDECWCSRDTPPSCVGDYN